MPAAEPTTDEAFGDEPKPGLWKSKLVRGGPFVAVKIWWGDNGEEPVLSCLVDGESADPCKVWPLWGAVEIDQAEYDRLSGKAKWAKENEPGRPEANPRKRINLRELPPVF